MNNVSSTHADKYRGIIPAFYACYDKRGEVDAERTEVMTRWLADKGCKGVYVCGSSGECIYQSVAERKKTLEHVMKARGELTVIAHVAANNTRDSQELAEHAESLGVDAIAAIPPIYFKLPEFAIAQYWNDISASAPKTDFMIYNIPQLAGVALTESLFEMMLSNPSVVAVKNSSPAVLDIELFKRKGPEGFIVFNGPDEQYLAGRVMGADGGIGGTYSVMPELYLEIDRALAQGDTTKARAIQYEANKVTYGMCSGKSNMYALAKEILRLQGLDIGSVRAPLTPLQEGEEAIASNCFHWIEDAKKKFCR